MPHLFEHWSVPTICFAWALVPKGYLSQVSLILGMHINRCPSCGETEVHQTCTHPANGQENNNVHLQDVCLTSPVEHNKVERLLSSWARGIEGFV